MRWDDLFADLERRFEELAEEADDAEQADRVRVESGTVSMVERLTGAMGGAIRLRLDGGRLVSGRLSKVGPDWLLVEDGETAELLVALPAVAAIEGLAARTGRPPGGVDSRFDLRKALRSVARDRAPVTVHTVHGTELSGTVDRVGLDFFELAEHAAWENRRAGSVRAVLLIPLAALVLIRSAPIG